MDMKVSFIIVALNAAATISTLLECLKRQTYPHDLIEVILVDGRSIDETKEIMMRFKNEQNGFERVVILDNIKQTLPCGWNEALDAAQGDAFIRVDAHATISERFIELSIRDLQNGEDICGGRVISVPADDSKWNAVLSEADNSMFGGGVAAFRRANTAKYVKTAAFAAYRKRVFDKVGRYNELLTRTEDNEMHYRMRKAGFQFYFDPEIISYRRTRSSLRELLKQKYLNGYWIGRTLLVEPRCFSLYHFAPLMFVLSIVLTGVLCLFGVCWPAALLWGIYAVLALVMTFGSVASCSARNIGFVLLPFIFLMFHLWYGTGTVVGILKALKMKISHRS